VVATTEDAPTWRAVVLDVTTKSRHREASAAVDLLVSGIPVSLLRMVIWVGVRTALTGASIGLRLDARIRESTHTTDANKASALVSVDALQGAQSTSRATLLRVDAYRGKNRSQEASVIVRCKRENEAPIGAATLRKHQSQLILHDHAAGRQALVKKTITLNRRVS